MDPNYVVPTHKFFQNKREEETTARINRNNRKYHVLLLYCTYKFPKTKQEKKQMAEITNNRKYHA